MPTSPDVVALMLADARLPTGGHTQSGGLEAAVRAGLADEGRRLGDVAAYARDRLRTLVRVEAGTAVVARALTLAGGSPRDVEPAWAARTPSQAAAGGLAEAGPRAGCGWPAGSGRRPLEHLPADTEVPRAVVVGRRRRGDRAGRGAGGAAGRVRRRPDGRRGLAEARCRSTPSRRPAGWRGCTTTWNGSSPTCSGLTRPDDLPADGAPYVDALAQQHATERMRLFHA